MKVFVILSVLAAGAIGARLDNTYIPPANAHAAGGHNLDTPKLALASNVQNTYSAPAGGQVQTQFRQQSHSQPGLNQGTFTSVSRGNGFQSVSVGAHSSNAGQYQGQASFQSQNQHQGHQPQQAYNQQQYQPQPAAQQQYNNYQQSSYQQSGYNQASTTPIPILKYENEPHQGDGRYRFEYLTGNGIMAQEEGYLNNPNAQYPDYPEQVAVGSYSYTAPDGQQISISYKADANGFQPEGAHLPQPVQHTPEYYEQIEIQRKVAAEVEAEGQRILALQAQLAQQQPQQNQYNQQGQYSQQGQYNQQGNYNQGQGRKPQNQGQQYQGQYSQQSSHQASHAYNGQASNTVYQQQAHSGYNHNAQPAGGAHPQQNYLPPSGHGKK